MNILVVDDHHIGRRLLRSVFEAEHMNVFEAGDGVEALATLSHDRIDAVVADILMPRMDGYQLCHEVRAREPLRATPFIVYSATYTAAEDERLALELGADRFLRKPSPGPVLVAAVRECIQNAPIRRDPVAAPGGLALMRNYSERLVAKLEERNLELEEARAELREANRLLEWRVQRRTEELAAANKQLESFASFVSHEVRSPLRTIGGYARRLEEELAAQSLAEVQRLSQVIALAARQTERLTDTLLTFCRLGAHPVRRRQVDLNKVVRAALASLNPEWNKRAVDVIVQALPPCDGDALLLEHVFRNLLSNALKFTRNRTMPRVEIGVGEADGRTVFFVRDNGVGFDMRYAALVFEPFQPLHREEGYEGTGLGLNLVRNIITRHGGAIWAESVVDEGTTIFFSLEEATDRPVGAGHPPVASADSS